MSATLIKFGTDGWRAVIAKEFTFENVARVTQGTIHDLKKKMPKKNRVVIGYDRRFLSREFAECVACVFAENNYTVDFSPEYAPTPLISWCAKNTENCAGGVVITASHNPPTYNGFKFKENFGGSALKKTTDDFEKEINLVDQVPTYKSFSSYCEDQKICMVDMREKYFSCIRSMVDVDAISKANFSVAIDPMYGSASRHFAQLLQSIGVGVSAIHEECNPSFGGHAPEPTEANIDKLMNIVKDGKDFRCGFANDGDADRLGACDEQGNFFSTQKILSVVYWHMLENRKKAWSISRSASTTFMVDLLAEKYGQKCYETPVGFKYIAEQIVNNQAQIGGEESGGIGIIDHLPERDGFLTALLLLEMMAMTGKTLAQAYEHVCETVRPYQFIRLDLKVPKKQMESAMEALEKKPPQEWNGRKVKRLSKVDGFKFYNEDGSWLLIRPSGTEPLFRLYAETESLEESQKMAESAKNFVEKC